MFRLLIFTQGIGWSVEELACSVEVDPEEATCSIKDNGGLPVGSDHRLAEFHGSTWQA